MRKEIETLVRAWVMDDRYYAEDFDDIRGYLLSFIGSEGFELDFFTPEEIQNMTQEDLIYEAQKFASRYTGVSVSEFLENY